MLRPDETQGMQLSRQITVLGDVSGKHRRLAGELGAISLDHTSLLLG